jgi:nucleoside 2-deoxyribosyltransferase
MKIFIICSVRDANQEFKNKVMGYALEQKLKGHDVYVPFIDTDQTSSGNNICKSNKRAIMDADEVHIFYNSLSQGTHFDMGVAFALNKKIKIIENESFGEGKSYPRMLTEWELESNPTEPYYGPHSFDGQ